MKKMHLFTLSTATNKKTHVLNAKFIVKVKDRKRRCVNDCVSKPVVHEFVLRVKHFKVDYSVLSCRVTVKTLKNE